MYIFVCIYFTNDFIRRVNNTHNTHKKQPLANKDVFESKKFF